MIGLHLAQYRIEAELGRGGMGIVYRATDTKLNRTVALKVLPAAALASEDERARFFREAQAAAQLNHPNIATVFQIDEALPVDDAGVQVQSSDGPRPFIAMEFVDGETLQATIRKGPFPVLLVANIAGQITEALKEAHAKSIVHRDIKSANIMLTPSGIAKVLDFGLAKTNQSTMLTRMGSTLGTVAYMSPEQARGQAVDGRSDLYSLGTVIYEMIAGRLPFEGDYEQAVLYAILNEPPEPLTALRTGVPMELERIVTKLLSKEAEYRYQTAADLLADLKSLHLGASGVSRRSMTAASVAGQAAAPAAPATVGRPAWMWPVVAAAVVLGLAAGWFMRPGPGAGEPARRFEVVLGGVRSAFSFTSPGDDRYMAFFGLDTLGVRGVHLYDLAEGTSVALPGLRDHFPLDFSPSGQWLTTLSSGGFYRTRMPTGSPIFIDSTAMGLWINDDEMFIQREDTSGTESYFRLRVDSRDYMPIPRPEGSDSTGRFNPTQIVFGGTSVLGIYRTGGGERSVALMDLETGEITVVLPQAFPIGEARGWLIYRLDAGETRQIVAQRFDDGSRELVGTPIDLTSGSLGEVALLGDNAMVFVQRNASAFGKSFSWVDTKRPAPQPLSLPAANYDRFAFSPDGSQIAVERVSEEGINIYIIDLETGTERRLTYEVKVNRAPSWSRDGRIYFSVGPANESDIFVKNADGSGAAEVVVQDGDYPEVSGDGRWLVFSRLKNGQDIHAIDLKTGSEVAIDTTALRANDATISPDGRFVAYSISPDVSSTNVGQDQRVVVRSFPDPGRQYVQVSELQADDPKWSPDGYLYLRDQGAMSRIRVDTRDAFRPLSGRETFVNLPGVQNRSAFHPVDGRLLVVHDGGGSIVAQEARFTILLGLERYLEEAERR